MCFATVVGGAGERRLDDDMRIVSSDELEGKSEVPWPFVFVLLVARVTTAACAPRWR